MSLAPNCIVLVVVDLLNYEEFLGRKNHREVLLTGDAVLHFGTSLDIRNSQNKIDRNVNFSLIGRKTSDVLIKTFRYLQI